MSASKPTPKPTGNIQSLEGTILRALSGAALGSTSKPVAKAVRKSLKPMTPRGPSPKKAPASKTQPGGKIASAELVGRQVGKAAAAEMATHARKLREQLAKFGLVHVETVRFRPHGLADRRLIVEYAPDPEDARSVLMRVRPASNEPLPEAEPQMLTTQQAADRLNVSRPYVARLVDDGEFEGVERTQSGHRRIPAAEVERLLQEMRSARRAALDDMAEVTKDLRARELHAAKSKSKRRWVAKQA
jgi:excisionase family DNA binding protein